MVRESSASLYLLWEVPLVSLWLWGSPVLRGFPPLFHCELYEVPAALEQLPQLLLLHIILALDDIINCVIDLYHYFSIVTVIL